MSEHAVQFYDSDEFLVDTVSTFVGEGLRAGEAVVVIATRPHLDALTARLEGLDLGAAVDAGRARLLDAHETLSDIMLSGAPDRGLFERRVEGVVDDCARGAARTGGAPRVRAFGEMVDILWGDGHMDAALRLEEFWHEVAQAKPLSLLCAYGLPNFPGGDDTRAFEEVCARHDRVLPAEGLTRLADARELGLLQQRSRALANEVARRRELERELENAHGARRRAEHESRVRDELLAAATQELRAPLKAIVGWSTLLRSAPDPREGDLREAAEAIESHARAQTTFLEDISDASRAVGGTLVIRPRPVDLAFLVRESVDAAAHDATRDKDLSVALSIEDDPCLTYADPHRIRQAFANVLANAVQFTPEGGRIDVRLRRTDHEIEFSVTDTGCGIAENALPFVFEGLRRTDGAARVSRRGRGLRLGLALTRHLVELHGGSIAAASQGPSCGATFTVRLPRRAAS